MVTGFVDRSAAKKSQPQQPPTASDLTMRVEAARASILGLQKQQYSIVSAATYDDGADRRYTEIVGQISELQRTIERDLLAISAMQNRERAAAVSQTAEQRRAKATEFDMHAAASVEAVRKIADALATATEGYSDFLKCCAQMNASLPAGVELPERSFQQFDYVVNGAAQSVPPATATAIEMHRLGDMPILRLPGAKPLSPQLAGKPAEPMTLARERVVTWLSSLVRTKLEEFESREEKALQ
jgi:hypothetical protein